MSQLAIQLRNMIQGDVRTGEPLAKHATFRIGGPADLYVVPSNVEELRQVILVCNEYSVPFYVIGSGSNLLVLDGGVRGLILRLGSGFTHLSFKRDAVSVGAAVLLSKVSRAAARRGMSGLEFAAGIPGTVGGAIAMNAGAFGGAIGDLITSVTVMDSAGRVSPMRGEELEIGYRSSLLLKAKLIALEAELRLLRDAPESVLERTERFLRVRRESQPAGFPSAGSIFKNPPGEYAGSLIESAGCKGMREGGAQVSLLHANFIVNLGSASARDVMRLIERVKTKVKDRFGIELEPEIRIIGEP